MSKEDLYISVDIETDGPIPGEYSMLSLGAACFTPDGVMRETFYRNLERFPGAEENLETMAWWKTQPEAWAKTQENKVSCKEGMLDFTLWCAALEGKYGGKVAFVAYPVGFDFTFVYWYLMYFIGSSPFSFSAIDIKTFAMALLDSGYRSTVKRNMPKEWFEGAVKHNHNALDDAIGQGQMFMKMLKFCHYLSEELNGNR